MLLRADLSLIQILIELAISNNNNNSEIEGLVELVYKKSTSYHYVAKTGTRLFHALLRAMHAFELAFEI